MQLHNGLVEVNVSMKAARLGRGQVQTPIPGDLGHPLQADCGPSRYVLLPAAIHPLLPLAIMMVTR